MKKQIVGALAFLGWSFVASACGLISGVSDDYTYERADGAADAFAADSPFLADATTSDAGLDAATCPGAIPLDDSVSAKCHACFVATCCSAATRCNDNPSATARCNSFMACLGTCKESELACRTGCLTKFGDGGASQLTKCTTGDCPVKACAAPP
jgi:hypothetical protein